MTEDHDKIVAIEQRLLNTERIVSNVELLTQNICRLTQSVEIMAKNISKLEERYESMPIPMAREDVKEIVNAIFDKRINEIKPVIKETVQTELAVEPAKKWNASIALIITLAITAVMGVVTAVFSK